MNKYLFIILFLLPGIPGLAQSHISAKKQKTGYMVIRCLNHQQSTSHPDSVLVILDRYNNTGAGVVKKIFYPDQQQQITVPEIQRGKYMLIIKFYGFHHEQFTEVVHIEKRKRKSVSVRLQDLEAFSKDKVIIPEERHNSTQLFVTTM
jgi:hypothetical protein